MRATGKHLRWSRFLDTKTRRSLIVPIDHGLTLGPIDGLKSARQVAGWLDPRLVNGVIVHKGMVERLASAGVLDGLGVMVHLNGMTALAERPDTKEMLTSIEAALRLGADAVSVQVNFTHDNAPHNLCLLGRVVDASANWGLPVLAMIYDKSDAAREQLVPRMRHLIRSAYELGIDAVKIDAPSRSSDVPELLADLAHDVSVFFAGGQLGSLDRLLEIGTLAVAHGAVGMCVGRNVFQRPDRTQAMRLLRRTLVSRDSSPIDLNLMSEQGVDDAQNH